MFLLFFIIYPQYLLILRESAMVNPHLWALPSFTIENMYLETTFNRWEWYVRKDGTRISSSVFPFYYFITWPWAPLDGFLSTDCIVLSLFLRMWSMIKQKFRNASSTIFRIAPASILLELPSNFFGHPCSYNSFPPLSTV